jgi:hypothetical protein
MGWKENALMDELRLTMSRRGHRLFRNNSGIAYHKDGSVVAYGVGQPGGSDLIGFTVIEVTPEMVGKKVAVFTAVEAKTGKLRPTGDQGKFLDMVRDKGGIATWGTDHDLLVHSLVAWKPEEDA